MDLWWQGCDGSVLLAGPTAERASFINARLHGFDVIDEIKEEVEKACPNTVSCADILAFAARDTVKVTGAKGWRVHGGRRDGRVSIADEVILNLPPPTFHAQELISNFAAKGLTAEQMVVLSGTHLALSLSNHCSQVTASRMGLHVRLLPFLTDRSVYMPLSYFELISSNCVSKGSFHGAE
jgi:peroxidase